MDVEVSWFGERELMLSTWNGTQSTNAGGSIHYYDFCEIDILTLNQTLFKSRDSLKPLLFMFCLRIIFM